MPTIGGAELIILAIIGCGGLGALVGVGALIYFLTRPKT